VYYLLYADNYEMPSKVAFDPDESSLGRIRVDSIAPPHTSATIKRCISRVERTPAIAHADLFADISCNTPLKEGHISILLTDGPGLSPNEPMAIVQMPIVQMESPSFPDGRYIIKSRAGEVFWNAQFMNTITSVNFITGGADTIAKATTDSAYNFMKVNEHSPIIQVFKDNFLSKWDITHDTNGNIFITSPYAPSSWVGVDITGSTVPVPWRLIPVDGKFY
jgi:hypothetical protein